MEFLKVILLGIVEGLTEFIPVSSTGHLIIVEDIIHLNIDNPASFQIAIQLGAILAVLVAYKQKITEMLNTTGQIKKLFINLSTAAIPVFIIGFLSYDYIKQNLFSTQTVATGLILGSIGMIIAELTSKNKVKIERLEDMSLKQSLGVGLFQIISLWPGMSRSGATIFGGLFVKLSHRVAADFSFLLALPVISAAVCYDLLKSLNALTLVDLQMILLGGTISFLVAVVAIRTFIHYLEKVTLIPFALYRIFLALVVFTFYV